MKNKLDLLLVGTVLTISILTVLGINSCDSGTEPPKTKSPRDYEWTIDTLGYPNIFQTLMYSIWGSSPSDVYTCGHISGSRNGLGDAWHYNGETWEANDYSKNLEFRGSLRDIHGISEDNVWMVGYKSTLDNHSNEIEVPYIIQYNGNSWIKHDVDTKSAAYAVHAVSKNEIWVSGYDGIVYHYKNNVWELDTIKTPLSEDDFFIVNSLEIYEGDIYTTGYKRTSGSTYTQYYFFKKENDLWKELDAFNTENSNYRFGHRLIAISPNKLLSYGSGGIYIWNENQWETYFSTTYAITHIFALGENNIIAVGSFGTKYHYNGSDWQELTKIKYLDIYTGVWANKDEAFIIGHTQVGNAQKTIVLHGK